MKLLAMSLFVFFIIILLYIIIRWWFNAYKNDEYVSNEDEIFHDFYTLIKESDDV